MNARKVSRTKARSYRGFSIIKVTTTDYYKYHDGSVSRFPEHVEVHFDFCKEGDEKKPSQDYPTYSKMIADCEKCIDNFIADDTLYFTHGEWEKYVKSPNRKNDYGYDYNGLIKIMKQHQKADKRMKILLEDRLEDANYHHECGLLYDARTSGDYEEFIKFVTKEYRFKDKFEILTLTEKEYIENPKQFEEGLSKVISDYLASQGVKNTEVRVNFIENW